MSKRIIIIGGGIAGLTAATLLIRSGFSVVMIEAQDELGGVAKSKILPPGYPTEHSLRAYHANYICLFTLLKTIPFDEQETLFEQLVPVTLALSYQNDLYIYQQKNTIFNKWLSKYQLIQFMRRQGFRINDFFQIIKEQILFRLSWERLTKKMGNVTIDQFLKNVSTSYKNFMFSCYQTAFAASEKTAGLLAIELDIDSNPFHFLKMANGPTSQQIIQPWKKYLLSLGVNIKTNARVIKAKKGGNDRISSVILSSGEEITGDIFLCATPYKDMIQIMQSSPELLTPFSPFNIKNVNVAWSNGAQYFLSDRPQAILFQPGIMHAHLSSPWKVITIVQGKGLWKDCSLPAGCQYILSVTFTAANAKGILYGKTLLECTKEEILNEVIAQCHFKEIGLIVKNFLDDSIIFMRHADYLTQRNTLNPHLAYQNQAGDWILNFSAYTVPTADTILSAPECKTAIANLYLAGDYCKATMLTSTMEKACETGYRAAQAISEDYHSKNQIVPPFSTYNNKKHRICRNIDAILFKIQHVMKQISTQ